MQYFAVLRHYASRRQICNTEPPNTCWEPTPPLAAAEHALLAVVLVVGRLSASPGGAARLNSADLAIQREQIVMYRVSLDRVDA